VTNGISTGRLRIAITGGGIGGLTLAIANVSPSGIATIDRPITQSGTYKIKTINLGIGPVQIWTVATPRVAR